MRKKAQDFSTNPFFYLILAGVIIAVLFFGFSTINKASSSTQKTELTSFMLSLNKAVKEQSYHSYGSVQEQVFTLPSDLTQICIIDINKGVTNFLSPDLADESALGSDTNIFFSPGTKYEPASLSNFELDGSQNPMCVKINDGKIKIRLTSLGNRTQISAPEQVMEQKECASVIYNGNPDNKIDIVFIGQDFKEALSYIPAVDDYIQNVFLQTSPFSAYKDRFNFYRIDDLSDMGCAKDGFIFCNEYKVKQLASNCPHDYIIVLMKRSKAADLISPLRSSSYGTIMNVNTADDGLVIMHEFGHGFADLADEYTDDSYYKDFNALDYGNCDTDSCLKWKGIPGTGCYKGCSLSQFFRATDKSIMNNYLSSNEYGIVNQDLITKRLEVYG
jgi:hypothetical protein